MSGMPFDPETGLKLQTLSVDSSQTVCPSMTSGKAPIFLGRSGVFFTVYWDASSKISNIEANQ